MKKMYTLLAISLWLSFQFAHAQDCTFYFPSKVGTTMEMKHYDGKDKLTGTSKTKITEKMGNAVKFHSEFSDSKGKALNSGDFEVHCKDGNFVVDMSAYTRSMNMDAYKNMEVKVETDEMFIPASLQPGMKLNDGEIRIKVTNQMGMNIVKMTVKIYNRVVESKEDITTPAGTFTCYKITYDIDSKVIFKSQSKGVEWISSKAGVVRSESHDTKGKLLAYSVLSSLTE